MREACNKIVIIASSLLRAPALGRVGKGVVIPSPRSEDLSASLYLSLFLFMLIAHCNSGEQAQVFYCSESNESAMESLVLAVEREIYFLIEELSSKVGREDNVFETWRGKKSVLSVVPCL